MTDYRDKTVEDRTYLACPRRREYLRRIRLRLEEVGLIDDRYDGTPFHKAFTVGLCVNDLSFNGGQRDDVSESMEVHFETDHDSGRGWGWHYSIRVPESEGLSINYNQPYSKIGLPDVDAAVSCLVDCIRHARW